VGSDLCITVINIHVHYCLDGQEPSVSLHFETIDVHNVSHDEDSANNDFEIELSLDILLAKYFDSFFDVIANSFPFQLSHTQVRPYVVYLPIGILISDDPSTLPHNPRAPPTLT